MTRYLALLAFLTFSAHSTTLELKKASKSIFVEEKKGWELGKDLFGMPFIYFSPQKNGQRSNISFTATGVETNLEASSLSKNQNDYQENKKKWAKQVGASILSFTPYSKTANKHNHQVHSIGVSYKHEGKVYQETSYYIECRGSLLFSKSLRLKENADHDKDFSEIIESMDCGGI